MLQRALLASAALVVAIMLARFFEEGDYFDPVRGRRHCGPPPHEIASWSYTSRTRRPEDQAELERWLQKRPDQVNQLFGAFCHSLLHSAARFGREDLAALLITRGANVNVGTEPRGETPLHLAAQYGHPAVAAVLVDRGADVNAATTFGRTPLHEAASGLAGTSDVDDRVDLAKLLIARGANVNARERGNGRTPLDQTTGTVNQERIATLLVEAGAIPGQ
jgi:Ankyrin repeats (3 copies)